MGKKDKNDKFYTKESIAKLCINLIDFKLYNTVIEPSAGAGSFSKNIQHNNLISLDLIPEHKSITQQDWFDFEKKDYGEILVITNPPFGVRNSLSKKFIRKALTLNPKTIAFILPDVYNKHTMQRVFPKQYRLTHIEKLPKDSFILNGVDYDIPCSFFIWDKSKGEDLRFDVNKYKTNDFVFVSKHLVDDSCFFILGASPSTVIEISSVTKNNRGYYIKPNIKSKDYLIKKFKMIKFKGYSSVSGKVQWLTKVEIIKNYIGDDK